MKIPRLPIVALLTASLIFASTPDVFARGNSSLKTILNKICDRSKNGDAKDIFEILAKEIEKEIGNDVDSREGKGLAKKIIEELKKNKNRLAKGVCDRDLDKVLKQARKRVEEIVNKNKGKVTGDESRTTNG
ncbi:MAG: hypothetical protein DVB27_00695 [Verrucomicrobia bacterium]|nr:MAG: hypothetical protein DVB27_00695 [Verrucomicrobiota bacterium]